MKKQTYIIIAVILVLIVLFIGSSKVYKTLKTKKKHNDIVEEQEALVDSSNLTITKIKASQLARKLQTAFHSGYLGMSEDEDAIYDVFKELGTKDDVLLVIAKFGVFKGKTLSQHVVGLFSASERKVLNSILLDKEIDYNF